LTSRRRRASRPSPSTAATGTTTSSTRCPRPRRCRRSRWCSPSTSGTARSGLGSTDMAIHAGAFSTQELTDVGRSFGGHDALADLNLTIRAGEFIALLGPSGCGKSTALNCLAGLLPLTHGTITIDGERIDTVPAEKRGFGMVFQNYALFPHLTVEKNIAFGLQMQGVAKAEITRRVAEAISLVKLEGHGAKLPGQLSGGQQQRVAIARAVVLEPRLVL